MIFLIIFLSLNDYVILQEFKTRTACEKARNKAIEPYKLSCVHIAEQNIETEDETED